jgi:hypothetical protein
MKPSIDRIRRPKGNRSPTPERTTIGSNIAIIVIDGQGVRWLRKNKVQHASTGPQRLPVRTRTPAVLKPSISGILTGIFEILSFPPEKVIQMAATERKLSALIARRLSWVQKQVCDFTAMLGLKSSAAKLRRGARTSEQRVRGAVAHHQLRSAWVGRDYLEYGRR